MARPYIRTGRYRLEMNKSSRKTYGYQTAMEDKWRI